jgi:DNA helicase HerA-like ATPase
LESDDPILRVSLRHLPFTNHLREIVVDAIGRRLLEDARKRRFADRPLLVAVDEAHQFFGRTVGDDILSAHLEQFETIAKEGRKYGLVLCMATQRPADLPAGVLSQAGMLLVHRLGDGRDREHIERASTELDRSAAGMLPALIPGEALFVGVDFPVPVAVRVAPPLRKPESEGPRFSSGWT